ncbi:CHASE4 domain-containing protein [Chloroflexota bacterium]
MLLRTKALLIITIALIGMVASVYLTSRLTLMSGLSEIEEQDAQKYIGRVTAALSHELSELEWTTVDWSSWDDTYTFIEDTNQEYIKSNLGNKTFVTLRLNVMLFFNSSEQLVFSKAVDLENEREMEVPPGLSEQFIGNNLLSGKSDIGVITSGIILINKDPILIVSQPILTSGDEGPVRGTLVFARYLNDTVVSDLAQITLSELTFHRISTVLPPDFSTALSSLIGDTSIFVQVLNTRNIAAYSLINDIYEKPVLMLRITLPRDIYLLGQEVVILNILAILGAGLIGAGLFMWVVHKQVLFRLAQLIKGINTISSSGDTSTRLSVGGTDELSIVAGTINGMLVALGESDIELNQRYEEEKELRQNLEREIDNRAEYTRALVHELKTPMTPVLAASELLLEELKEPNMRKLVESIDRSASNLNRRIDELLDLARGEVGQLTLNLGPLDPLKVLTDIAGDIQSVSLLQGQIFTQDLPEVLPLVMADEERFKQIVQNLLNNSIKFTPNGGKIALKAREDGGNLVIEISDTGRGISVEEQKRLFEPYHRSESDRERLSGLGLGLALAKRFVDLHGGQIWVESKRGEGTKFTFTIPITSASQGI